MTAEILAFTDRGHALAQRIAELTGGSATRCRDGELSAWTAQAFEKAETVIFVGAAGIAVRAIAPFLRHKAQDPAVLVVDEGGRFVIPVLSGHIGGANEFARRLAGELGAVPVITTATDGRALFAVDVWAKEQNCSIPNPERIKTVSAKLLAGENVKSYSEFPVKGEAPAEVQPGTRSDCNFALTIHTTDNPVLACVPRILTLGIGCRKGTSDEELETRLQDFLSRNRLQESAVCKVCSIDLKKDEPGLLSFCRRHGWPLETFPAERLRSIPGDFSASAFVADTVGVDNVCERSAVLGSGGRLLICKDAGSGVTIAAAISDYTPAWK